MQPSSKAFGAIESEKTFVDSDTDRQSRQETAASPSQPEDYPNMSVEEETPNIDLKEVFVTDKRKGKENHRSKSKLRGRVTIKKSELEAEGAEEEGSCDFSQDLQISGVEDEANKV